MRCLPLLSCVETALTQTIWRNNSEDDSEQVNLPSVMNEETVCVCV